MTDPNILRAKIRTLIAEMEARPGQEIKPSAYWTLAAYVGLYLNETETTAEKLDTFKVGDQ